MWWILRRYRQRAEEAEADARRIRQMAEELRDAALQVEAENQLLLAELNQQRELLDLLFKLAHDGVALATDQTEAATRYRELMQLQYRPSDN